MVIQWSFVNIHKKLKICVIINQKLSYVLYKKNVLLSAYKNYSDPKLGDLKKNRFSF